MEIIKEGYTRVTDILSIFQGYAHVPREKLKRAQEVGTDVHNAIEAYFKDEFTPLDLRRGPYFESFLKWADVCHPKPLIVEKRYYDDHLMITGKIDLLAEIGGEPYIIDFKTGSWAHPEIWRLQGTFYRELIKTAWAESNSIEPPEKFIFVQLQSDGGAPILYEFDFDPKDMDVCLGAIECYDYFKKGPCFKSIN